MMESYAQQRIAQFREVAKTRRAPAAVKPQKPSTAMAVQAVHRQAIATVTEAQRRASSIYSWNRRSPCERIHDHYYFVTGRLGRMVDGASKRIPLGTDKERAEVLAWEWLENYQMRATGFTPDKIVSMLARTKARALKCGRDFDLDKAYLVELAYQSNFQCSVSGIGFEIDKENGGRVSPWSPSIDRRDSTGGYTKDNVRLVCYAVNVAMNEWGEDVLRRIAGAMKDKV